MEKKVKKVHLIAKEKSSQKCKFLIELNKTALAENEAYDSFSNSTPLDIRLHFPLPIVQDDR